MKIYTLLSLLSLCLSEINHIPCYRNIEMEEENTTNSYLFCYFHDIYIDS